MTWWRRLKLRRRKGGGATAFLFLLMVVLAAGIVSERSARAEAGETDVFRYAVVVGANAAPQGRATLRYAHRDADAFAEVLAETGGFPRKNVIVLRDPEPKVVLDAVERGLVQAASHADRQALLVFFYSGHANANELYPGGKPLPVAQLQAKLSDGRAAVRLGIIDACRGGGWTGSKGLAPAEPFDVDLPSALSSEGAILIASSSGVENAHESELLQGSFFTHHWIAALRGAGDANEDGTITAHEAFAYARALTVKDTARLAGEPQHPSFRMDLKGRDELELASLARHRSLLVVTQRQGPLEVTDLRSGTRLLETEAGPRRLRLALPPGSFLVRRHRGSRIFALEVNIAARRDAWLDENELLELETERLGHKGLETAFTPEAAWDLQIALGVRHAPVIDPGLRIANPTSGATALLRLSYGLSPRWHIALPLAVAYSAVLTPRFQTVGWLGVPVVGGARGGDGRLVVSTLAGLGSDFRWFGLPGFDAANLTVSLLSSGEWQSAQQMELKAWTAVGTAGGSWNLRGVVTLNFGVALAKSFVRQGKSDGLSELWSRKGTVWAVGSVQRVGLRPLPLVGLRLTEVWSLEGHVTVAYLPDTERFEETYLVGTAASF
ncbi:MAG: caspase family protein [Myxococcales bacterium]|nr:caspase family protein [Myxococcales bacterium]